MGVGSGFGPPPPAPLGADFAAGVGHCARAGAPWVGFSRLQMPRDFHPGSEKGHRHKVAAASSLQAPFRLVASTGRADRAPSLGKQRSARARERALARSRAPKFRKG